MANESMRHPCDAVNEAHELLRRGASIAWLVSQADEDQLPERTMQDAAEAVAAAMEGLKRCVDELFAAYREAAGLPPVYRGDEPSAAGESEG